MYTKQRFLLKVSGEAFFDQQNQQVNQDLLQEFVREIIALQRQHYEICLMVGGGNILRGHTNPTIHRATADCAGMLATVINALFLQDAFLRQGTQARIFSALSVPRLCDDYHHLHADQALSAGSIVILAAGSGQPYFTTDTAAVLRAAELNCHVVMKGTKVPGIFSDDPLKNPNAQHYPTLTYQQILDRRLKIMDLTAITLAQTHSIPLLVFSLRNPDAVTNTLKGIGQYTWVQAEANP